uniref:Uncharacterized protein n=1 Tax=Anguilla anguilla TaxID=7936 RepID=A0A0E9PMP6_ANGAN
MIWRGHFFVQLELCSKPHVAKRNYSLQKS